MPAWAWVVIAVVVIVALVGAWLALRQRRTQGLKTQFGSEYDRAVTETGGRRAAESELEARRKRRESLNIQTLDPAARERYASRWERVQARFVDAPSGAVTEADELVQEVMRARGYPVEDFAQREADISVDHPQVVENYRAAHAISMAAGHDQAGTEDLRQAMVHYRALFLELLGGGTEDQQRAEVR
jgi:hypothetical protein